MLEVVTVVAVVVLLGSYTTWTAGRMDRLRGRVATTWATLDAQLVRRAAAATELAAHARRHRLLPETVAKPMEEAGRLAAQAQAAAREDVENDLSRAIATALAGPDLGAGETTRRLHADLAEAVTRVGLARQFYNDAVRDTLRLRRRWLPRLLRLRHRHEAPPRFFEIADTELPGLAEVHAVRDGVT